MSYLGILSWPMMAFGWAINIVQRGAASMDRLNKILEERPEIADGAAAREIGLLEGRIEVKGLTWTAGNGGAPLLQDIHLEVKPGELVILVGRTGAGKTLLCNLLGRVLEPPKRSVFVDGVDIHQIPLRTLRRSIGFVPQDTFLFSETIRENIAFGKLDATEAEIDQAARIAQIYDEIMGFPEGMETTVGEKGITLSGGQRQRIAIARAILIDPPIFILDDALSSVDIQTEERILKGLETFLKGRTCLLVTHRIAPLRRADRIIVLERGKIAEMGEHGTLLARGGIYADLYWREQLEEELEKESNH